MRKHYKKNQKKRAIILALLAFGGLSVGSFGFLPFLLKSWNTLQYNIVDFKHINHDNLSYEIEFALSDLDSYKLNYQDLNVDFTSDQEGRNVVASHVANYDEFSRSWRINSNYTGLSFGKRYYLKVYLDDKKQKRFAARKLIGFSQHVANFVDTPPAVSTINFETKTPSSASVSVRFADEAANLEGKKVALEYYYVLKNQTESLENADEFETKLNNAQEIHTSYVDAAIVKDGKAEFNLVNLHPGLDYKISAIRYIDKENKDQIPLAPMQKIALDSQVDFEKDASKKALFEATTAKIKLLAKSLIDQNLSSNQKRVSINFASLQNTAIIQNKPIQIVYKNLKTAQKFVANSIFAANLASFDLIGLEPGSSYQVESFALDATNIEFSPTFIKNFYTPAAIVDAKIALGASFANVELSVASADDLSGSEALLYLDDSSIIPATGVFQKTDQANIYKIKLTPSGLINDKKYALDRLVLASSIPNSVFRNHQDGYDYSNIIWAPNLEIGSPNRNFITKISELSTFIKLEPKIYSTKVEYTFGFLPESAYLSDKNLYLYYYKKSAPSKIFRSKLARAQSSEIKFELIDFESSDIYKIDKIQIDDRPDLAIKINFDQNKETAQKLKYDEFFIKYHVSDIKFENISETTAKVAVTIDGDFKNSLTKNQGKSEFSAKLVFGEPGFAILSKTIKVSLQNQPTQGGSSSPSQNFTLSDNKLILHFDLANLNPKTEYQIADLEIPELAEFFSSGGILDLRAKFTTLYKNVKILGANFDNISEKSAQAIIYFDPTFNSYLNNYKFKAKFKDQDGKIVSYPNEQNNSNNNYPNVENNVLKISLSNLVPGHKYTFIGLDPAPNQDQGLTDLSYQYIALNKGQNSQSEPEKAPYFYTTTDISAIRTEPKQDEATITISFATKDPNFKSRPNTSEKQAVLFAKNNATGAIASAISTIKYDANNGNTAKFTLKNLDKLSHYTISEILVDSELINFSENLKEQKVASRNFYTVANTATVIKIVQYEKTHNKIGLELSFDPLKDTFLENDSIKVLLRKKKGKGTQQSVEATGTVGKNLVLKLEFSSNIEAGTEYEIERIIDETKDKNIQTSVGFAIKKAENYSPSLQNQDSVGRIFSAPELKGFSVTENKNENVKISLDFEDQEKSLVKTNNSNSRSLNPNLTLILKNTKTNALVTATGQAKDESSQVKAEFTFSQLDRNVEYVLESINDFTRSDSTIWVNPSWEKKKKAFTVNVDKIEVKDLVYSDIKSTSVKTAIYFDPIKDWYLENKEIEVEIDEDQNPKAVFVAVSSSQSQTHKIQKVSVSKLPDGRLVANLDFTNLKEGSDFKIKSIKLVKKDVATNQENQQTGPKFTIVDEFNREIVSNKKKIGEINETAKQKTLKFATDIVISDVEFNPSGQQQQQSDLERSQTIKVTFANSNNEILKLKQGQKATITLLNTKTQKFIISSATITAQESTDGDKKTTASASFDFKKQLEKLTKYTISSISVIRTNGIYQIPFSATIKSNSTKTSFVTQLNTINVVDVQYSDISPTSVLLTTFFDALEDSSLNDQFEAELEYQLKNQNSGQSIQKTTKVSIQNNQASFLIEKLSEASAYEIKNLVLYKKSGAVRRARALRTKREASDMIQNLQVVFDNNKVVTAGKKEFATKSLISSIKINPALIKQKGSSTPIQVGKTNITDTSVGVELQIKDPKKFFADYAASKPKASQVSQIQLMLKSHRTGAIAEASATIEYAENNSLATAKFSFTDLEKYTLYSIVNIFINGVPVGFLNSITEEQKKFHTTANEVLPESFTQLEYHKHGAVVRMVFDVKKNWFLVNNKVKLSFKIQGQNGRQDQSLVAEATVQSDGVALFKIDGESIKEKVPSGTRFEISDLVLIPEYNNNQAILQHFPLEKYGSSDKTQVISQAATETLQSSPLRQKRNLLSLFESNDSPKGKLSQFSNSSLFADTNANNFAKIGLKLAPLSGDISKTIPKTFDTAAYAVSVRKQSLAGNTAEISIKINSTYLLDKLNAHSSSLQLKYIDISSGATETASLSKKSNNSGQNGISSEWVFRAQNLKPLDYYQLVSITQTDNGQRQVINFDDDKVSFQDKLFRTTPNSYSVVDIQRTLLDENQNKAHVKLQLDEQAKTYLEGYKVRLTYKRQDPINVSAVQEAQAKSVIKSDGSVDFILEDKSVAGKQKTFQLPVAAQSLLINQSTNTLNSPIQDSELIQSTNFESKSKNVDQSKLFEGFSYQIQKLEIIGKPDSSSNRKKRSTSASSLIDYNISFNARATFQSKDSKTIEEKKIIQGIPITIYDQLISTTEKEFSSGVDTKIYAYFISSEKLSAEDQDKQHFKVQLYNKSLAKYETIIQAENIQKLQAQNGQSNFYLVTFSTNLNKASLYDIVKYTYQGKEIKKSEYKTNNVNNTEFITPASKVKLTNFAQVPIYEDTKASAYFQFDEKDEFLWRTKQKIDIILKNTAKSQETKTLTITPTGAFSQVELSATNTQLEPNTKYELVSYKLNDQAIKTPIELPNAKNKNLKIKIVSSSSLVQLQNHKNEIQKVNLSKEDAHQKTPANLSIETKAHYTFNDSNFTQRGFDNNNGKTGKITINLNKELSQIPKAFGEITISKTSPKSNSESITLSSTQAFDSNSGSLEFMVRNLERFQEYKLTSVKLNGVEIKSSSADQNTFTPKPTEILVEDITWGSQTVSSSLTPQQNATVSQNVTINFSKDDTWLDNNQILVTPVKVGGTPEQSQLQGKSVNISQNKASVNLNNLAPGEEYTLKLELTNSSKRKKRSLNPSIPIKIPEKQYNQEWTPKIEKTFITPPVIKKVSFTPPKDKDSAASLTVDLLGSKLPKNHPILLTYKPKQVPSSLQSIISSSPTTVSPKPNQLDQNKLVYSLPHLVPIDYTLLNFKVLNSELKFNNDSAKQISGSSSSSSLTKMEFSPPIPDPASEIIITPEPRTIQSISKQSFILTAPLTSQYKLAENNNLQVEFNPFKEMTRSPKAPQKFTKIVKNWTPNTQNNTITAKIEVNEQESPNPKVQPGQVFKLQLQNSSPSLPTEQPIYYVPNTLPSVSAILKTNVRLEDWQTQLYSFEYWVTVYDPNSALVNLDLKSENSLVPFKEKVDTSQNPGPSYYPIPKLGDLSQTQANILKENLAAQFAPSVATRASVYIKALKPNNEAMLQEEANKLKTEADKTWQQKVQKLEKHISSKKPRIRRVNRTFITQSDSVFKFKLVGTLSEIFAWNPTKVELTYKIFPSLSSTAIKTEKIQQSSSLSSSSSSSPPLKVLNPFKPYDKIKLSAQKPPDNELPYLMGEGDFLGQFEGTYFIPPASTSGSKSSLSQTPSTLVPRWSPLQLAPKLERTIKNEKYWSNYIYYQDSKFWENRGQNRGMNEAFEFLKYQTEESQRIKKYVFLGPRKIKPIKQKPTLESKANNEAKQFAQSQKELWIEKYEYIKTENKLKLTLQNPGKDNKAIIVPVADPVSYYVEINSPLGYMQTLKLSDLHFEGNNLILSVSLPNNENWNPEGIQSAIPWIVNRVYAKWESGNSQARNVKYNHHLVKINPNEKYTIAPKPGLAPFIFYT
ncbi:hypothetical protein DR093_01120 [Mycoplasma flocculare]|uniref:hypothetical protein n=1 Tax=Mesomycoplasma flocculare TaxID=2128 RepID=UPI00136C6C6A|nr:hypothetical protein [Mesomycoplasma flocculare]MXR12186.1 hypothetical protein [Mesomycoplasma flocculare]